jgi:hypothetical protein
VSKVFTVDEQRKAVEKKVELGQTVGDAVEVMSGLEGALPVVIEGRNKLATGTPVTVAAPAGTQPAGERIASDAAKREASDAVAR